MIETSEFVLAGHPDMLADTLADLVVDYIYQTYGVHQRAAVDVLLKEETAYFAGELTVDLTRDDLYHLRDKIHQTAGELGYTVYNMEFNFNHQSGNIALNYSEGYCRAGDQGVVYGYSTIETPTRLPQSYELAQSIADYINRTPYWETLSDGKVLVTVLNRAHLVDYVSVSLAHTEEADSESLYEQIRKDVVMLAHENHYSTTFLKFSFNPPNGKFISGGLFIDTGLTGRKNAVNTYGGLVKHGGGALSGKDLSKLDRLGSYVARALANAYTTKYGEPIETMLAFEMGGSKPVTNYVLGLDSGTHYNLKHNGLHILNKAYNVLKQEYNKKQFTLQRLPVMGHFNYYYALPWEKFGTLTALMEEYI